MSAWISTILQVVVGFGLLNVWLIRAKSATSYRGGAAMSLKEEFTAYGLPEWVFYLVGTFKISSGILLIAGVWIDAFVMPAAGIVAALMVGALAMHVKVKDPLMKSLPAFLMLVMSVGILVLR